MTNSALKRGDVRFYWNGRGLHAPPGEPVAVALRRNDISVLARSRKLHRPLGLSGSYIAGVLARVDGRPNVRLDQQLVAQNLRIELQNVWPSAHFDLLRLARLISPRHAYGGFEHSAWTPRSKRGYLMWERVLANLAGMSPPPEEKSEALIPKGQKVDCDTLVVGGGPFGRRAANGAAATGEKVCLVTRGYIAGRYATACGVALEAVHPSVTIYTEMELFGCYRRARLCIAAPHQHDRGAMAFEAGKIVLATGRRSMPPLVSGSHIPGVMDSHTAVQMSFEHGVPPGRAVVVVGTGSETLVAERLRSLGVNVVYVCSVHELQRIDGRDRVVGINAARVVRCDAVVHAGPWRADPSLPFQAGADGIMQLSTRDVPTSVRVVGAAAGGDEPIQVSRDIQNDVLICPCMDVTAGELLSHIDAGETDPEVLKRLTSCGMGPCQGYPCWESLIALLSSRTGLDPQHFARPSHRAPRRSITVAQAAGLFELVSPER